MSYYGNRGGTVGERKPRNTRKDSVESANTNGNNNGNAKAIGSYISNYTRSTENSLRTSIGRKSASSPRTKSNLVGSMKATFEQLNKESLPPPASTTPTSPSALKSPSNNRVENATTTTIGQKTTNTPKLENGTATTNHTPKTNNTPKLENGTAKHDIDDDDVERTPSSAKPSSSARRGKQQRQKRMLRQKRRSTGVVSLKESDDEKDKDNGKEEKDEEATRKSETEKNTLSNELSPPPSANSIRPDSERTRSYEVTDSAPSILKGSVKSPTSSISSTLTSNQAGDNNVFLTGDSTSRSPTMPNLNSSRRRVNRSSSQQESNREIEELREKLAAAESTISKLTTEVGEMDTDLKFLAEENQKLKRENKMLEDENTSMLMVLKQLRNSRK